ERIDSGVSALDLLQTGRLDFEAPDQQRFPCLRIARQAAQDGGTAPAMLNAANEVAVDAFLNGRIRVTELASIIADVLDLEASVPARCLADVFAADAQARTLAARWLHSRNR